MDEQQEAIKEPKPISKKEAARRKKLSERKKREREARRKAGHRKYIQRVKAEKRERDKEKKRLARIAKKEKEKERAKIRREKEKAKRALKPKRRKKKAKKAKKIVVCPPKINPIYNYRIFSCINGSQNRFVGEYCTSKEAYEKFNELKKEDKNVIFPKNVATTNKEIENSINEYVLVEKSNRDSSILRNEYGKLVEHRTNIDGWTILDKFQYKREETFWVYGYDNRSDRKTFLWVYENLLFDGIKSRMDFKRVLRYKNKIIFKDDNGYMDIIFCKDEGDAIKFYNMLEEWTRRDKIKQILFMGDWSPISAKRKALEDEIMELTGWTRKRVQMKNTAYYMVPKN